MSMEVALLSSGPGYTKVQAIFNHLNVAYFMIIIFHYQQVGEKKLMSLPIKQEFFIHKTIY